MLDANVSDHGLVLGEDINTQGRGPLLSPGRHRRHEAPDLDILQACVMWAACVNILSQDKAVVRNIGIKHSEFWR